VKLFSKNSNLCDHNPPTSQTDRQTDGQTTCDGNTALCTKVHRAVKIAATPTGLCRSWPGTIVGMARIDVGLHMIDALCGTGSLHM